MSAQYIELLCYLSSHVRKNAAVGNVSNDCVPWRVNATKPFEDADNFGALSQSLGIHTLCEICDYSEGVTGDVIDTRRTPEELGFRPGMAVYLRQKRAQSMRRPGESSKRGGNQTLSLDEESVLNRMRENIRTTLTPDQPCPLCNRLQDVSAASPTRAGSSPRLSRRRSMGNVLQSSPDFSTTTRDVVFKLTSEVGVQCGTASRVGDALMPVAFGSAARFKSVTDPYQTISGSSVDQFPAPSTLGGPNFLKHDGELTELKTERDRYKGERDQLSNLLREEQRKVHELQRERMEHRCEGNEKVQTYIKEIERLQANLRDLMRGRDEVYSLLHQRRTAAAPALHDAPKPYAPFRVGAPLALPNLPDPHDLLSKSAATIPRDALGIENDQSYQTGHKPQEVRLAYADEEGSATADIAVVKRPSGPAGGPSFATQLLQPRIPAGPPGHLDQPVGQAMLQMFSSIGDPYYVKRLVNSHLKRGRNFFVLSSLDHVVTDEIEVDQLVSVRAEGEGMLSLTTNALQWVLYMNARERQRWINWVYVLNPWLSTRSDQIVPNNF